jgi:hypothetical protein
VATGARSAVKDDEEPPDEDESDPVAASAPAPAEAGARVRQAQSTEAKPSGFNVDEVLKDTERYKGGHLLTKQEKAWITGVDANGLFIWAPEAGDLICDAENKEQMIPERVHCNPYIGRIYPEVEVA